MATIRVFLKDDRERKRKSRKRYLIAFLGAGVLALGAVAKREPSPVKNTVVAPPQTPQEAKVVEKIVYVDRLQYAEPIGPKAVQTPPAAPTTPPSAPAPIPRPRPVPVQPRTPAQPPPTTAAPPPATPPVQPPLPRLKLLVEPTNIYFRNGGSQKATVINPNSLPVTVFEIRFNPNQPSEGFSMKSQERCYKALAPGERCSFTVTAARGITGGVGIQIRHNGGR